MKFMSTKDFLLAALDDQGLVDVGDHTSTSNGSLDQSIKFFVSANGQFSTYLWIVRAFSR